MEIGVTGSVTSARIVLGQECLKCLPAATHSHHDSCAHDSDQTYFLGITELWNESNTVMIVVNADKPTSAAIFVS